MHRAAMTPTLTPNPSPSDPTVPSPAPTRGPILIGLSGYANVGKDAAAETLIESGWHLGKFSQPLKDAAYDIDPVIHQSGIGYSYRALIDAYGVEEAKEKYAPVRPFMQRLGKAMRTHLGEDVLVNAALAAVPDTGAAVFVDCRFPNEADAIRSRDGLVVRINRPGVGPAVGPDGDVHESETALDDYPFDAVIDNDGTLEELRAKVGNVVADWILGWVFPTERATQG